MIKPGTYLIYNVEYERPLYYDEQEKRLQVVQPGQLATKVCSMSRGFSGG
jgi:hypothetical protein